MDRILQLDPSKVERFLKLMENKALQYTGNGDGRQLQAAVKSLGEKMEFELENSRLPLNFVIFNLQEPYRKNLVGWSAYREETIYQRLFGIWIFESGTFENEGLGSYENWRFGGYKGGNWTRGGEPVKLFRKWWFPFARNYGQGRLVTFKKITL